MKKILFVCTGNTCRSPMAELLFNKLSIEKGIKAHAQSAGLCTIEGLLINDNSKEALLELGVESDFFRSKDIYDLDLNSFDLVIGMTNEHISELKAMGISESKIRLLGSGIADPYGSSLAVYKTCRDEINNSLGAIINEL